MKRRRPRWSEVKDLLQVDLPSFGAEARVARTASIEDLRRIAKRRTPKAVFDYTDGAAGQEAHGATRPPYDSSGTTYGYVCRWYSAKPRAR